MNVEAEQILLFLHFKALYGNNNHTHIKKKMFLKDVVYQQNIVLS